MLDSYFDEPEENRSNQPTVEYLATIATAEGIDIAAAVGNPAGGGIHAKWFLARHQSREKHLDQRRFSLDNYIETDVRRQMCADRITNPCTS